MHPLKIIIVDDHPIFRKGLKNLLSRYSEIGEIIIREHFNDVKRICETKTIDLIIMDIDLGNTCGVELTKQLNILFPKIHILAMSGHKEQSHIYKMMDAGASGFLLKDSDIEEVFNAIQQVLKGNVYLSSSISRSLIRPSASKQKIQQNRLENRLTIRELEILNFIIRDELSNKEIADRLFISPRTVETHKRNLIQKLKVKNTIGLVKYYFENQHFITENYGIPVG